MKILCAWCGSPLGVTCTHCAAPLLATEYAGSTFQIDGAAMVCLNGETPLLYAQRTIDKMPVHHAMCAACEALTETDRSILITRRRETDPSIPDDRTLSRAVADLKEAFSHERATRQAPRPSKKRGPTTTHAAPPHAPEHHTKNHGVP
jgi:hypothetical protein